MAISHQSSAIRISDFGLMARALFNGLDRHCTAPFVCKRALVLLVRAFAPLSSLRSSIHDAEEWSKDHPESASADSLERFSHSAVRCCENRTKRLMKLCDELEANLRRSEDRASKLVEAVVQEMVG
jgi:hypothetical protein